MDIELLSREQIEKTIEHLKSEISSLRTGRATPALIEDIIVLAYGTKQAVKAVASISVEDAKTLVVEPWDKSVIQDIEIGLRNSDIGISPVNDGKKIRLPLPELTQDRRQELVKVLHKKLEEARIAIRKIREDIRGKIEKAEKAKEISEDDRYTLQEDLDKIVKEFNEQIKKIGDDKEKEVMTV
jgi:ribosome recycling factor